MIFVLLGASCSGKTEIMKECEKVGCRRVITNTTRQRRQGETDKDYKFLSKADFQRKLQADEFVEHAVYNNEYYGVDRGSISESCVVILEPQGFRRLKEIYGDKVFAIYIKVSPEIRMARAKNRDGTTAIVERRFSSDTALFDERLEREVDCIFNTPSQKMYPNIAAMCAGGLFGSFKDTEYGYIEAA